MAWIVLLPLFALGMRGSATWVLGYVTRRLGYKHLRNYTPEAIMWFGVLAIVLAPVVFLALYTPTAFDATLYHLPDARTFVHSGRLVFAWGPPLSSSSATRRDAFNRHAVYGATGVSGISRNLVRRCVSEEHDDRYVLRVGNSTTTKVPCSS